MDYAILKDGIIVGITKDVELDLRWKTKQESEGYEFKEIPSNIKDEEYFKLVDGEIIIDEGKKTKDKENKDKQKKYKKLPSITDYMIAEYEARHGDNTKLDAIDSQIADALK